MTKRASGVLLHPSSLANRYGIGDLGESACHFLDWLHSAGQSVWQILPLSPPGQGQSPYDAKSSFAGDDQLISLEELVDSGLLDADDLDAANCPFADQIDHEKVRFWKGELLRKAWHHLQNDSSDQVRLEEIAHWAHLPEQTSWLPDWALFAALKQQHEDRAWTDWPQPLRDRDPDAIDAVRRDLADEIRFLEFVQFLFYRQIGRLRDQARDRGISLLGDLPFYVAMDSCDVWTHPHLFDLDSSCSPRHVAGVPPDYFSATGQRWGNPIYRWDRLAEQGYSWWVERLASQLRLVDRLRLDHFRAFAGYWEIPASEPTAAAGYWRDGPGLPLFEAVEASLGQLPFVAEDLGVITPDVEDLRARLDIPGMRVLQFAFDSPNSPHVPHNLPRDVVLYTGTHDNDTARGWIESVDEPLRARALDYLGSSSETFHWDLLRTAETSVADLVVTPIQDIVGLDGGHRINTPGTTAGNWAWRLPPHTLTRELADRLRRITELSGRAPAASEDPASASP